MGLREVQTDFLNDVAKLIVYADEIGIELTFGETYRTEYQQEKYIADGKSKTMNSQHLKRLAVDFNFFIDGKLTYNKSDVEQLGIFWESLHYKNEAGMFWEFQDTPHFQREQ